LCPLYHHHHYIIIIIFIQWTGAKLSNILDYQTEPTLTYVLSDNFLLLLLHVRCTTDQTSFTFGYLYLLAQGHQGPLLHFLKSSQLKKLKKETRDQEIPQWLMYRPSWSFFFDMLLRYACFTIEVFF